MDDTDKIILKKVQEHADKRLQLIEKETKIPRTTIHNRIQKLKKEKIITQIKAIVDPIKLELPVCALIHIVVSFKQSTRKIAQRISALKNVESVHITAGQFDIVAKVRFRSNKELSDFIFDDKTGLKSWPGIQRTESMLCLDSIKENGVLEP